MKRITSIVIILLMTISLIGQKQLHTEFNSGGDLIIEENVEGLPQMNWHNATDKVGEIGLSISENVVGEDDLFLRTTTDFGKIRFLVNSGGVTINPNQVSNSAFVGINWNSPTAPLSSNIINGGEAANFVSTNTGKAFISIGVNDGITTSPPTQKGVLGVLNESEPHNLTLGTPNTNTLGHLFIATQNTNRISVKNSGEVYIGDLANFPASVDEALNICGNVRASGDLIGNTFSCNSDERFKSDIEPLKDALTSILDLNGVSYNWDTEAFPNRNFSDKKQIGLIAQEVETIFPELVMTDNSGYKSIDYVSLTAILIEAIKEQDKKITKLEKLSNLEERIIALEASM